MRAILARLAPRTVAGQLIGVLVAAVLIGISLASAGIFYLIHSGGIGPSRETLVQVRAARIAAIVHRVETSPDLDSAHRLTKRINGEPVFVGWGAPPPGPETDVKLARPLIEQIEAELKTNWGIDPLPHGRAGGEDSTIYVRLDDGQTLRFVVSPFGGVGSLVLTQVLCTLAVITLVILFVSAYAVRSITAPLSSIASTAKAFGRPGDESLADLDERGPIEVGQAARALNEMRRRVRVLVDERTRMLVAVSHDLRTPLTRLRLRIERLPDGHPRTTMLEEIAIVNEMLTETLAYMREAGRAETPAQTDLPSLLQTIAAQFSDAGHDVAYAGPDRLVLACRPHALTRAVNNLVDNAAKFGSRVEVAVEAGPDRVEIEVRDDGPGIPDDRLSRVFEPFYKVDDARGQSSPAGFGLGLSIVREIVTGHGGAVELCNRAPHGVVARITLPRAAPPKAAA
jgi:signal transduction histidine kinase